jgi:hypothetical protein
VIGFDGTAFRALFAGGDPLTPASAPEGRFHHSGQFALYASLTPEGCAVAIKPLPAAPMIRLREIAAPVDLAADRLADLRGRPAASAVWQDIRAGGRTGFPDLGLFRCGPGGGGGRDALFLTLAPRV